VFVCESVCFRARRYLYSQKDVRAQNCFNIGACPKIGMKRNLGMTVSDQLICLYFIRRHHVVKVANDLDFSIDPNPDTDNIRAYVAEINPMVLFLIFKEPRNRFQGINSVGLCSLAGRYDYPIPTRFLVPLDCSKIPAQRTTPPPHFVHNFLCSCLYVFLR
jgi:hypothetical protein